jgi:hypothetical protein
MGLQELSLSFTYSMSRRLRNLFLNAFLLFCMTGDDGEKLTKNCYHVIDDYNPEIPY